jgi:cytochrome c oxidase subunit II
MPVPATEDSPRILSLWQGSWIAALVVGAVVWGLILWSVIFHRRRAGRSGIPVQTRYNIPIETLYTVVPFLIISVLFFFTARDETKLVALSERPQHVIDVYGIQWSWQFGYVDAGPNAERVTGTIANPPVLVLPEGERVRFRLTSTNVIHSFWVPAFLMKMDVVPGRHNQFEVTPSRRGTFAGRCAELCGTYHSRMIFTVKIVSPEDYRRYIAGVQAGASSNPQAVPQAGRSA